MRIRVQKLRAGTPHQGYRIALPKSIIEAKGWENAEFLLEDAGDRLILRPLRKP